MGDDALLRVALRKLLRYGRAIIRIRELHHLYRGPGSPPDSCAECSRLSGYEVPYPCPTIQILDREVPRG